MKARQPAYPGRRPSLGVIEAFNAARNYPTVGFWISSIASAWASATWHGPRRTARSRIVAGDSRSILWRQTSTHLTQRRVLVAAGYRTPPCPQRLLHDRARRSSRLRRAGYVVQLQRAGFAPASLGKFRCLTSRPGLIAWNTTGLQDPRAPRTPGYATGSSRRPGTATEYTT